jgi:hypothetical protein
MQKLALALFLLHPQGVHAAAPSATGAILPPSAPDAPEIVPYMPYTPASPQPGAGPSQAPFVPISALPGKGAGQSPDIPDPVTPGNPTVAANPVTPSPQSLSGTVLAVTQTPLGGADGITLVGIAPQAVSSPGVLPALPTLPGFPVPAALVPVRTLVPTPQP